MLASRSGAVAAAAAVAARRAAGGAAAATAAVASSASVGGGRWAAAAAGRTSAATASSAAAAAALSSPSRSAAAAAAAATSVGLRAALLAPRPQAAAGPPFSSASSFSASYAELFAARRGLASAAGGGGSGDGDDEAGGAAVEGWETLSQERFGKEELDAQAEVIRGLGEAVDAGPVLATAEEEAAAAAAASSSSSAAATAATDSTVAATLGDVSAATSAAEVAAAAEYNWFSFSIFPQLMADAMTLVADTWGVPWLGVIVGGTVAMRVVLFPLTVATQKNTAKLALVSPQLQALGQKAKSAQERGDRLAGNLAAEEMQTLLKTSGANPLKSFAYMLPQAFVLLPSFFALRKLAETSPTLAEQGFYWVPSLAAADPTYALPAAFGASMIVMFEAGADPDQPIMQKMRYAIYGLGVLVPVLTYHFPAAIHIFWIAGGVAQGITMGFIRKNKAFRKWVGIPDIPKDVARANKRNNATSGNPLNQILEKIPVGNSSGNKGKAAARAAGPAATFDINQAAAASPTAIKPKGRKLKLASKAAKNKKPRRG